MILLCKNKTKNIQSDKKHLILNVRYKSKVWKIIVANH